MRRRERTSRSAATNSPDCGQELVRFMATANSTLSTLSKCLVAAAVAAVLAVFGSPTGPTVMALGSLAGDRPQFR